MSKKDNPTAAIWVPGNLQGVDDFRADDFEAWTISGEARERKRIKKDPKMDGPRCIRASRGPIVFVLAKNVWYTPVAC
jgi:hypothetical protein